MSDERKLKDGAVSTAEKQTQRAVALRTLAKVKNNKQEQRKVPVRLSRRTVVLVSPAKARAMKKHQEAMN